MFVFKKIKCQPHKTSKEKCIFRKKNMPVLFPT